MAWDQHVTQGLCCQRGRFPSPVPKVRALKRFDCDRLTLLTMSMYYPVASQWDSSLSLSLFSIESQELLQISRKRGEILKFSENQQLN